MNNGNLLMVKKLLNIIIARRKAERRAMLYSDLIRHEAKIGGELFGPVHAGGHREFFCLDERTWVWHEEWTGSTGRHSKTVRYDVRPDTILKSQQGHYQEVSKEEADNLVEAVKLYQQRVRAELYSFAA